MVYAETVYHVERRTFLDTRINRHAVELFRISRQHVMCLLQESRTFTVIQFMDFYITDKIIKLFAEQTVYCFFEICHKLMYLLNRVHIIGKRIHQSGQARHLDKLEIPLGIYRIIC